MDTDVTWTWTILFSGGGSYHVHKAIELTELLERFRKDGHRETEIEAIVRH